MKSKNHIIKVIYLKLQLVYSQNLSDETIKIFAELLQNYEIKDIQSATSLYLKNPENRRIPQPGQLIALMPQSISNKDLAIREARKLINFMNEFGKIGREKDLTEIGKMAAQEMGGYRRMEESYNSENSDPTIFFAQLRNLCEAIISKNQKTNEVKLIDMEGQRFLLT